MENEHNFTKKLSPTAIKRLANCIAKECDYEMPDERQFHDLAFYSPQGCQTMDNRSYLELRNQVALMTSQQNIQSVKNLNAYTG